MCSLQNWKKIKIKICIITWQKCRNFINSRFSKSNLTNRIFREFTMRQEWSVVMQTANTYLRQEWSVVMQTANTYLRQEWSVVMQTANTYCFLVHLLATSPDVQERVYSEIVQNHRVQSVAAGADSSQLKYLNCVIKEAQRYARSTIHWTIPPWLPANPNVWFLFENIFRLFCCTWSVVTPPQQRRLISVRTCHRTTVLKFYSVDLLRQR